MNQVLTKNSDEITPKIQFRLPISLMPFQQSIYNSTAKRKVICAGRRTGKTTLCSFIAFEKALSEKKRILWVSPVHRQNDEPWGKILNWSNLFNSSLGEQFIKPLENRREFVFMHGGKIRFGTGEKPQRLRSSAYDLIILDEAAYLKNTLFEEDVEPSLWDTNGDAIFISTPKGKNWFYTEFQKGKSNEFTDYESWHFPTSVNTNLANLKELIEDNERRKHIPKVQREFFAEFTDKGLTVFPNIDEAIRAKRQDEPLERHNYIFGIDWGRYNDATVIAVFDVDMNSIVRIFRFTNERFKSQVNMVIKIASIYSPYKILVETNSIGLPQFELLQDENLPVVPINMTNQLKVRLVQDLAMAFETKQLAIYPETELIYELENFQEDETQLGKLTYNAPSGIHDDSVIAVMLAWHGKYNNSNAPILKPLPSNFRQIIGV